MSQNIEWTSLGEVLSRKKAELYVGCMNETDEGRPSPGQQYSRLEQNPQAEKLVCSHSPDCEEGRCTFAASDTASRVGDSENQGKMGQSVEED
ncbi:hypothetical protein NMY22_g4307 [Coprinellus aureogranulatus]|nr:hypothetical protein NMY22_g4307 [Coprinellus aureogranulatus]